MRTYKQKETRKKKTTESNREAPEPEKRRPGKKSPPAFLVRIPTGSAGTQITPGCIALEGGAFRGIYTSGVLDVLMQEGINFETTIGVSAGALNSVGYVSGNLGRTARIFIKYRNDPHFAGLGPMLSRKDKGVIGFDFLLRKMNDIEPLNLARLMNPRRRLIAVATALTTGWPVYFEKDRDPDVLFEAVRASASMPYVSMPVSVQGIRCLDGGCSVRIPYRWALEHGFKKIVVVRTRDRGYRPKKSEGARVAEQFYAGFPDFAAGLARTYETYTRELDELDRLEAEGRVFVIAPSLPINIGYLEYDVNKLGSVYFLGVHDAKMQLDALREYLAQP